MKISLCMIVKDEIEYIEDCLNSAMNFVDEIIVVDTGSSDGTLELLTQKFNKKLNLEQIIWENDFSKARNVSIAKAKGDWILVLDGDEIIKGNPQEIRKLLENTNEQGFFIHMKHIIKAGEYYESAFMPRLFRNNNPEYKGRVHEQIFLDGIQCEAKSIPLKTCSIDHYGYFEERFKEKDKAKRNIDIIMEELKENPEDGFHWYNLGVTLMTQKKFDDAIDAFVNANKYTRDKSLIYMDDLAMRLGFCMYETKRLTDLENYLKDIEGDQRVQNFPQYHMLYGQLLTTKNLLDEAILHYEKAVVLSESFEQVSLIESGSYKAKYEIALIYERQKKTDEAIKKYSQVLFDVNNKEHKGKNELLFLLKKNKKTKELKHVKEKLAEFIVRQDRIAQYDGPSLKELEEKLNKGEIVIVKEDLKTYLDIFDETFQSIQLEMILQIMEGDYLEAERNLLKAIKIDNQDFDLLYNAAYLYKMKGNERQFEKFKSLAQSIANGSGETVAVNELKY